MPVEETNRGGAGGKEPAVRNGYACVLAGATGLVGSALLRLLIDDPAAGEITVLARRPLDAAVTEGIARDKLARLRVIVASLDDMDEVLHDTEADIVFCTLGTTIKAAKTREAFRKVDFDYPLALAKYAQRVGASVYAIVTAMGASTESAFFYSRVKGELEGELAKLKLPLVQLFRPSLLLGQRKEKRPGETVGAWLATALGFTMVGPLRKYRAIRGDRVAAAMHRAASAAIGGGVGVPARQDPAVQAYESDEIAKLGAYVHTGGVKSR